MANVPNHTEQGGAVTVIGEELRILPGARITSDGVQAAAIPDIAPGLSLGATSGTVNTILVALRGAGIIAE